MSPMSPMENPHIAFFIIMGNKSREPSYMIIEPPVSCPVSCLGQGSHRAPDELHGPHTSWRNTAGAHVIQRTECNVQAKHLTFL